MHQQAACGSLRVVLTTHFLPYSVKILLRLHGLLMARAGSPKPLREYMESNKTTSLQKFSWYVPGARLIFKHKRKSSGKQLFWVTQMSAVVLPRQQEAWGSQCLQGDLYHQLSRESFKGTSDQEGQPLRLSDSATGLPWTQPIPTAACYIKGMVKGKIVKGIWAN